MEGIIKLIKINLVIIAVITVLFTASLMESGLGSNWGILGIAALYLFMVGLFVLALTILLIVYIVLLALKSGKHFKRRTLNGLLAVKLLSTTAFIIYLSVDCVNTHYSFNCSSIDWDLLLSCFDYAIRKFVSIGIITSIIFIKAFKNSDIAKEQGIILWLSTIFPVIDTAVAAALRYQPKENGQV